MKSNPKGIEDRLEKATPEEWEYDEYWESISAVSKSDFDFINHASEDLRSLLEDVKEAKCLIFDIEAYFVGGIGQLTHLLARIRQFLKKEPK